MRDFLVASITLSGVVSCHGFLGINVAPLRTCEFGPLKGGFYDDKYLGRSLVSDCVDRRTVPVHWLLTMTPIASKSVPS